MCIIYIDWTEIIIVIIIIIIIICKTVETSVMNVNNNSFQGLSIVETFEKWAPSGNFYRKVSRSRIPDITKVNKRYGIINDNCSAPSRRRKSVGKFYIEKKKKRRFSWKQQQMKLSGIKNRTLYLPLDPSLLRNLGNSMTMSWTVHSQLNFFLYQVEDNRLYLGFQSSPAPFETVSMVFYCTQVRLNYHKLIFVTWWEHSQCVLCQT